MNNLKSLLPLLLLICGVYLACNKDDIVTYGDKVRVTFAGRIVDESGQAVTGAQVLAGQEQAYTDKNGVFRLKPILADARNAILYVKKIGYFDFSRAYVVRNGSIQNLTIQLLEKVQIGSVDIGVGGSVDLPGGAKLSFPGTSISLLDGTMYSGSARIFARYLDPASPDLALHMPGDLRGINTGGTEGVLSTFGMIGVEMESPSGQPLKIRPGSEVEIRMPIPASKVGVAPQEIALWHYDVEQARWIEEGSAQKVGNEYVGKVKHFSFWNCDAFSETVYMEGKVFLGSTETPLSNAQIKLTVLSNGFEGFAATDADGWYGGAVPKGYEMKLEVLMPSVCGSLVLYAQNIGPFSSNTVLPDIIINDPTVETVTIQGRLLDCNGLAVVDGYAKIEWGSLTLTPLADADGNFELNAPTCTSFTSGTVIGYDLNNLKESSVVHFNTPPNTVALGDISVCADLAEYIQYSLDGQPYTIIDVSAASFQDSSNVNLFFAQIFAVDSLNNIINFSFKHNNQPGTFDLLYLNTNGLVADISGSSLSTTVSSAAPNVGDTFIGTFGTTFKDHNGVSHTLSGNYRVIRSQ